jgi:hypothetical protein
MTTWKDSQYRCLNINSQLIIIADFKDTLNNPRTGLRVGMCLSLRLLSVLSLQQGQPEPSGCVPKSLVYTEC